MRGQSPKATEIQRDRQPSSPVPLQPTRTGPPTEPGQAEAKESPALAPADTTVRGRPSQLFSSIETSFADRVSQAVPSMRQFGYDVFESAQASFTPITDLPVGPDYIVGPGDQFIIASWGQQQLRYELVVSRDGQLILPEIGPLRVWGLTFSQAEALIKQAFDNYYVALSLYVTLGQIRSITVFVLGEVARPGAYTLSSLSTLLHALMAAGGPTKQGTLRNIQLFRSDGLQGAIDLYQLLLKGDKSQDQRLHTGDTIFVPLIRNVVGITGNVKRPAIYEVKEEMTLADFIQMAGGVTPLGYVQTVQLERVEEHEKKIILDIDVKTSLDGGKGGQPLKLKDGDIVRIFPISERIQNHVELAGNVERPGRYQLQPGMRIRDLLALGHRLLPETYMKRGEIERFVPPDNHREIIPFDLGALLGGDEGQNLPLQTHDKVTIYSVYDFKLKAMVSVEGAVRQPGTYPFLENMRISDLVYRAGGLREEAFKEQALLSRINSHRLHSDGTVTPEFFWIELGKVVSGDVRSDLPLERGDTLTIYSIFHYGRKPMVKIRGAVRKPGEYELFARMKLSDLMKQAGGVTLEAHLPKVLLIRVSPNHDWNPKQAKHTFLWLNAEAVLKGDPSQDAELQDQDEMIFYPTWFFKTLY